MAISVVRLGTPRGKAEGLRIGTVRRPPRGVPRSEFASRNYYDVWLPELAPDTELFAWVMSEPLTEARWKRFEREYARQMREPARQRLIALLAALSRGTDFSVGCYCENEARCHRSILRRLLGEAGADIA